MANRLKGIDDYVREPTKSITLSIPISQYQVLETFAEATHRTVNDVVSDVFSDTTIVSIRRMLAPNAKTNKKKKNASRAPAKADEPAVPALPDPAASQPTLPPNQRLNPPTRSADHTTPDAQQQPQERPALPTALQSPHQPPSVPPAGQETPPVAPHTPLVGNPAVPPGSRPAASGLQPNFLPPTLEPTRPPIPPLQPTTKPTDEPSQKPPAQP